MADGPQDVELVIIGGGLTGLALAAAVGGAGLGVLVIEQQPMRRLATPGFDGRVTAVAQGSRRLLEAIGVWPALAAEAQPIRDIAVGEDRSPIRVHYDHREVGVEPLGHIVENARIRDALLARIEALPGIEIRAPVGITALERDGVSARLELSDRGRVRTPLVAAAEGKRSRTREAAGIGCRRWNYHQTAIVCTLAHERPHHGLAVERFFPDGPFARLPLPGDRSSIVWALDEVVAREVVGLDDRAFEAEVAERFGDDLGELTLTGPRWSYPLDLVWADAYVAPRLVLVGDAARGIHPIAGQGWNLALRDVAAVAELVVDRVRLGLDPGDAPTLERYARWRRFDSLVLVAVTDGINRLFA
ncbi:MAG TPA: UbiH/UbiF/VisC/COQ6 family ubiquinone biosynthesis hydroxylase, partial [Geminicoccaceae bacterium]|nr:UbiH/UbiF/VisC/COQ6 family ubiquinone biosynthesis hydroxylase [Geminicoccaceae bacterium]